MVNLEKGPAIYKEVGVPWLGLYKNKKFLQAMDEPCNILLGHNRSATVGNVTKENAHPFKCEHIIGAHNGTLYNRANLEGNKAFEVDSENIFHHMSIHGVDETVNKLQGAFALVWYNQQENTINFVRNTQRTLYFAFSADKQSLFWASEQYFLLRAAQKAKIKIGTIFSFKDMFHYKIAVPPTKGTYFQKQFGKLRIKKLMPHRYQTTTTTSYYGYRSGEHYGTNWASNYNKALPAPVTQNILAPGFAERAFLDRLNKNAPLYFTVDKAVVPSKARPYLVGHVLAHPSIEVRLNPMYESDQWEKLNKQGEIFFGKIKKFKRGYLLVSVSSVKPRVNLDNKEADPFEKEEAVVYSVGGGRLVTKANFLRLISAGCAVCNNPLSLSDEAELDWYLDSPVCPNCHVDDVIYA